MVARSAALLSVLVVFVGLAAGAQEGDFTQGSLHVVPKPGEKLLEFPLKHTDVQADVAGMVAHVTVAQEYENPFDRPIEAVYVFPLPDNAAINDMVMQIGGRTVRGIIQTREQARETYERAIAAGQRASLLEQERPNIFTQSVGNILPDDQIKIIIQYVETLSYVDGKYEYVFPMVVGPRFIPGSPMPTPASAGGWAPNTDQVPDASRITPPVLKPEFRTGHDISVTVRLNAGVPIRKLRSESHDIKITRLGSPEATVTLQPHDTIPNKDFELQWEIAGDQPEIGLLTHNGETGGFFLMLVAPKGAPEAKEITAKEMVLVQDCSGSMSGFPIERSKEAMRRCIKGMNPNDSFQIIRFSEAASQFSPTPIPNTPENVAKGLKYIDEMSGQGGTQMIEGIKAALTYERNPERMRIVCFMTDGFIGNEAEILAAIQERLGDARLFSFGIGSSVNRYLLDRMAEVGRGVVDYVNLNEDTEVVVNRFYERIRAPYLTDLAVDWGELETKDVFPQRIPDLFSAQPVLIYGRYDKPGSGPVKLSGKIGGKPWSREIHADLPKDEAANEALSSLWARRRVRDLMTEMYRGEKPELVEQVTQLGLDFRLMTNYTSFVAVDEKVVVENGERKTVHQPVPMPEGVSFEGVFGPPEEILGAIVGPGSLAGGTGNPAETVPFDHWAYDAIQQLVDSGVVIGYPKTHEFRAGRAMTLAEPGMGGGFGGGYGGYGGGGYGGAAGARGAPGPAGPKGATGPAGPAPWTAGRPLAVMRSASGDTLVLRSPGMTAWWLALVDSDKEGLQTSAEAVARLTIAANGVVALPSVGVPVPTTLDKLKDLVAAADKAKRPPLPVILVGREELEFSDEQRDGLNAYLGAGGFLIVMSASEDFSATVLDRLATLVPALQTTDDVSKLLSDKELPYQLDRAQARTITLDGRVVGVVLGREYLEAWSEPPSDQTNEAYEFGVNVLAYALQDACRTAVAKAGNG